MAHLKFELCTTKCYGVVGLIWWPGLHTNGGGGGGGGGLAFCCAASCFTQPRGAALQVIRCLATPQHNAAGFPF